MRLQALCVVFSVLASLVHPECRVNVERDEEWTGMEIDYMKPFVTELVESAVYGFYEHGYSSANVTHFMKDRMDRCFPSGDVSLTIPNGLVVFRTDWHARLVNSADFYTGSNKCSRRARSAVEKALFRSSNLAHFLVTRTCEFSWTGHRFPEYIVIELRISSKTTANELTTLAEPACDASLPEGRIKWCRRISYFFTRFKC
ncbi:hypothetical protein AAVH_33566 [Aphelenchoides avenae]|nr:hypothetical protein AAVH_33566 [Aphelenchus avenae]